jgi:hypothetical protein
MMRDLAAIRAGGFTVVSVPSLSARAAEAAAGTGLRFLLRQDEEIWNGFVRLSRGDRRRLLRGASTRLRATVRQWGGSDALAGVQLSIPQPSPEGRSGDRRLMRRAGNELALAARDEANELLVGWSDDWPGSCACPEEADFLTVGVGASTADDLADRLTECHARVGDRPLVVGGIAADRPWAMDVALERGAGGTLARAAQDVDAAAAAALNGRTIRDLASDWPTLTVVINAYNAEATLEECLAHCRSLDYPSLEVVVVDDGSTDRTPAIAEADGAVRLVSTAHVGLSAARNVGLREASGELVVYLDADAYPSPEWPWYIAHAALAAGDAGGSGGPNIPPPEDSASAKVVAQIPGGPVPQLRDGYRADHLPGCNMAFWRRVLEELDGFDPVIAGSEDLELEWRLLEAGKTLAYHPAAFIWHHRRGGLRPYLRQQRNYGRGQAILERRCPERFPPGLRLKKATRLLRGGARQPGMAGPPSVRYLSLPQPDIPLLTIAHQWGMPVAALLLCTAPLGLAKRRAAAPAATAGAYVSALFVIDALRAGVGRRRSQRTVRFRTGVAVLRVLRPLAFRWGHLNGRREFRRIPADWPPPPASAPVAGGVKIS